MLQCASPHRLAAPVGAPRMQRIIAGLQGGDGLAGLRLRVIKRWSEPLDRLMLRCASCAASCRPRTAAWLSTSGLNTWK
jgi:hypothetical protein